MEKITEEQYQNAYKICLDYKEQIEADINEIKHHFNGKTLVKDTDMSPRLFNILRLNHPDGEIGYRAINTLSINHVRRMSMERIKRTRNCGKKSIQELKEWCIEHKVQIED